MQAAVIVVSYNTRDLLDRCLASIFASIDIDIDASNLARGDVAVVVVDNASADGSAEMVARRYPAVRLIESHSNLGFTGANNLALAHLGFAVTLPPAAPLVEPADAPPPDYVLLLNSDAELAGDALGQMLRCLQTTPRAGMCGARLQYGDGRFQHGAFRFPTLFQIALDFFPLDGLPGAQRVHDSRFNGRYPARLWQGPAPFRVDFVLGAAMMVRGAAVRQVGGLDDGFFMYCEEIDWCMRLADAGWATVALPTAVVTHHAGQSSLQVRWAAYTRLWRSRLRLIAKHPQRYSPAYLAATRALMRAGSFWRMVAARRRFAAGEITGVELAGELAAHRHVARLATEPALP